MSDNDFDERVTAPEPAPASRKPQRKVAAAGTAGAATVVLVWVLSLAGVDVPSEVASAITGLLSFAAGYAVSEF